MRLFSSIGLALLQMGSLQGTEIQIDGDLSELEIYSLYEQSTGINLVDASVLPELETPGLEKTPRLGLGKGNDNARRQALIRIMFNVLNRGDKNDKNFIRKIFNYGCHCYPGGPRQLLKTGHGKPLDEIDTACQKHKNCYKCIKALFNDGSWLDETGCNPENTAYKMVANLRDYTVSCRVDQTSCRKSLCECDLQFATSITEIANFDQLHNHTYLERNGFDYASNCPRRGSNINEDIACCGDKKSFPSVDILNGKKDACCANLAYNSNREECCSPNVVTKVGNCSEPTQNGY